MKNINLNKIFRDGFIDWQDQIAILDSSKNITFSELSRISPSLRGLSAVLYMKDTASLICLMAMLDGSVKTLCPVSASMENNDLDYLLSLGEFDVVITDMSERHLKPFERLNIDIKRYTDLTRLEEDYPTDDPYETIWLIPTSGTTSKPKLVRHTLSSLAASALKSRRQEADRQIWGLFYDPTRFAGYQTVFNALINGHCLVVSLADETMNEMVKVCAENRVTHISATPTQWRKILMSGNAMEIPLKQIVLGGEAADQPTLDALRKQFPSAKITHTYASTEAGLGISVSDGLAGFPLRFLESSSQTTDIAFTEGRLYLRSPSKAMGYGDDTDFKDENGWVDTGDLVKVEGERFYVIGRANGAINIGGDKVNPNIVRESLLEHPQVIEARVYGKKNPITGMLLAADLQLGVDADAETVKRSISEFLKDKLQQKDRPRVIRFVEEIQIDGTGKMGQRQ